MEVTAKAHLMYGTSRVGLRFYTSDGVFDIGNGALTSIALRPFMSKTYLSLDDHNDMLMTGEEIHGGVVVTDISDNPEMVKRVLTADNMLVRDIDKRY